MVALVVHANHPTVDRKERAFEAARHRPVEILALVLRHLEDDLRWIADPVLLKTPQNSSLQEVSQRTPAVSRRRHQSLRTSSRAPLCGHTILDATTMKLAAPCNTERCWRREFRPPLETTDPASTSDLEPNQTKRFHLCACLCSCCSSSVMNKLERTFVLQG